MLEFCAAPEFAESHFICFLTHFADLKWLQHKITLDCTENSLTT